MSLEKSVFLIGERERPKGWYPNRKEHFVCSAPF